MTMLVTSACAGCADKLRDHYELKEVEEIKGKCPWCGNYFSSMSKYIYRKKQSHAAAGNRYRPRHGGGERNRQDDD